MYMHLYIIFLCVHAMPLHAEVIYDNFPYFIFAGRCGTRPRFEEVDHN